MTVLTTNWCLTTRQADFPFVFSESQGPRSILKNWKWPSMALRAGASFLEPMLSETYERWDARKKGFDLLIRLAENHYDLIDFLETYALNPIST